jgi:hypothetical protein
MQLAEEQAFDPTRRAIESRKADLEYERLLPMGARSRINAEFQSPAFRDVEGGASSSVPGARAIESGPPMETRAIERDFGPTKQDPMGGMTVGDAIQGRVFGGAGGPQDRQMTEFSKLSMLRQKLAQEVAAGQRTEADAEKAFNNAERMVAMKLTALSGGKDYAGFFKNPLP